MRKTQHSLDPHCHWCKVVTLLIPQNEASKQQLPRVATIDHVKSRAEVSTREEWNARSNKVLACHDCNQLRNVEFMKANAGIKLTYIPVPSRRHNTKTRHHQRKRATFVGLDPFYLVATPTLYYQTHY